MTHTFEQFVKQVEKDAEREGPEAVARLEALRSHFAVANQLLTLRRKRKFSQSELAKASGIPQSEISRIERGRANPTVTTLNALARPLGAEIKLA